MRKKFLAVLSLAFAAALSAGVAVAASAEDETLEGFKISSVAVRTENFKDAQGVEIENSSGIRFKTDAPEKAEDASYYTTVSVAGVAESKKVNAESWRTDGSGWNTVIAGVPSTAYATPITVTSYVEQGGKTYASNTVTSSLAEASALALANGEVSAFLTNVVDTVVADVYFADQALSMLVGNYVNYAADLFFAESVSADASKYAIVYQSNNAEVATVDANGKIVAVGAGEATITATIGSRTDSVVVTVADTTAYDFENGYGLDFITPTFSTEKTVSVVDFNGSKALKMTSTAGEKNLAFDIDGAYLDKVFEDSNVNGVSFDLTFVFEISGDAHTQVKADFDGRVFSWNKYQFFDSNETQKINISRPVYDAWKVDADAPTTFRVVITNRTWALEWYIDNLQVTTATADPVATTYYNGVSTDLFSTTSGGCTLWKNASATDIDQAGGANVRWAREGKNMLRTSMASSNFVGALRFRKGTNAGQLQAIFADPWVSAFTFYMFNPSTTTLYADFCKVSEYSSTDFTFADHVAGATVLQPYQWTKITLTREVYEANLETSTNDILYLRLFAESAVSANIFLSIDSFHAEYDNTDPDASVYFASGSSTCIFATAYANGNLKAGTTYPAYEGTNSLRALLGTAKQWTGMTFRKGTNRGQLQAVFADENVTGYSFYVYNPNSFDAYMDFCKTSAYPTYAPENFETHSANATKLVAGQWTKVTLTREVYEANLETSTSNILVLQLFAENTPSANAFFYMDSFAPVYGES